MKKLVSVLFACVIVAELMLTLVSCSGDAKTTDINLNDYISIETDGYNGYGTVSYTFNSQAFANDYSEDIAFIADDGDGSPSVSAIDSLVADVEDSGCFTQEDYLSNGDQIVFSWDFNPEVIEETYNVNLEYEDIDYTVNTLQELSPIDLFENISMKYSGFSEAGTASIVVNDLNMISSGMFSVEPSESLSDGDTVTVTFLDDGIRYLAENYGMTPQEMSREYTVEGLYTFSGVSDNILATAKNMCMNAFYGDGNYFEIPSSETNNESGIPRYYVSITNEYGVQLLNNQNGTAENTYNWSKTYDWLAETKLESIDYVGYYLQVDPSASDSEDGTPQNKLYLVYDVHFSQYGSTDANDPTPITGGTSDFEYYWCPYIPVNVVYNDTYMSCGVDIPSGSTAVIIGSNLTNITYYVSNAQTGEISHNEINYIGYSSLDELYEKIDSSSGDTFCIVNIDGQ